MTATSPADAAADADELDPDEDVDDGRRGPGPALWITLVVAALVFGGAVGWRIAKGSDQTDPPGARSVDVGFFQDMVTHHNQALTMATDYLEHGDDALLKQIASEILFYQSSEIGVMNDHLTQWGQSGTDPRIAMRWMAQPTLRNQMYGLATPEQMNDLAAARGAQLNDQFTRLMIVHHAGGVHMAQFAARYATTETVRSWAQAMVDGQKGEIAELNRWRVQHGLPSVKPVF